jgi:hypothetical protein
MGRITNRRRVAANPYAVPCSKCGASVGAPCVAVGIAMSPGSAMQSVHAARKRSAARERYFDELEKERS